VNVGTGFRVRLAVTWGQAQWYRSSPSCIHLIMPLQVDRTNKKLRYSLRISLLQERGRRRYSCTVYKWTNRIFWSIIFLVKKLTVRHEIRSSLPCSRQPAIGPYPQPYESSLHSDGLSSYRRRCLTPPGIVHFARRIWTRSLRS